MFQPKGNLLAHGGLVDLMVGVLKNVADFARQIGDGKGRGYALADEDLPMRGFEQTVEVFDQRGLARPVRPDQRDELAGDDGERYAPEGEHAGIGMVEVEDAEGWQRRLRGNRCNGWAVYPLHLFSIRC